MLVMPTSLEQATVSTESRTLIGKLRHGEDDGRHSATHLAVLVTKNPGLPLTTALQSLFKGLRYSTEAIAVGSELEMLKFASRKNFSQLLAAKCFLVATFLAVLLDLLLLGNTLSSQVKSNCEIVIADTYHR